MTLKNKVDVLVDPSLIFRNYLPVPTCPTSSPECVASPSSCTLFSTLSTKHSLPVLVPTVPVPSYSCLVFWIKSSPRRCSEVPEAFCVLGEVFELLDDLSNFLSKLIPCEMGLRKCETGCGSNGIPYRQMCLSQRDLIEHQS
jgi:hypothetical protein